MTKAKPKAKSAVSGRYVKASDAKANPRETYQTEENHEKCVRLKRADLVWMVALFDRYMFSLDLLSRRQQDRAVKELTRAIAAHGKAAK